MSERAACRDCAYFRNESDALEAALPGLTSLSSADGATRADDGLCAEHDRFVNATSWCPSYARVTARR